MSNDNQIQVIEQTIYGLEPAFNSVLSDKSILFAREAEFALQIITSGEFIRKIAAQNPQSVRDSVTNLAAIGLSLNPAKKQAYLIPRKGGVVLQISWMGLVDLAVQCGSILWAKPELYREGDTFEYHGPGLQPTHKFNPFSKERLDAPVLGAYCVAKTHDGDYLTEMMATDEIVAIRDRSDAWKAWLKDKKTCPWVTDPAQMFLKTTVRRGSKHWPRVTKEHDRLSKAIHHIDTETGEGLQFVDGDEQAPPPAANKTNEIDVDTLVANVKAACSMTELKAAKQSGQKAASRVRNKYAYDAVTKAAKMRHAVLTATDAGAQA